MTPERETEIRLIMSSFETIPPGIRKCIDAGKDLLAEVDRERAARAALVTLVIDNNERHGNPVTYALAEAVGLRAPAGVPEDE